MSQAWRGRRDLRPAWSLGARPNSPRIHSYSSNSSEGSRSAASTETGPYAWVLRPVSEGTRSGFTGGGSVAQRTAGLVSGRLVVRMTCS
jgi:hypothetical protein